LTRLWSCPPPCSPSLASNASWRGVFSPHPPHHHPLPSSLPRLTCRVTQHIYDTTQHNTFTTRPDPTRHDTTKLRHEATATTPYTKRHDTVTTRSDTARRRHGLVMMRRRIGHCVHPPKGTFLLLYSTSLTHHLHPQKRAVHARFRGWSLLGTTTTTPILENEPSMLVFECGHSLAPPPPHHPRKQAPYARFQGWLVALASLLQPTTTTPSTLENELVHSFSMVLLFF